MNLGLGAEWWRGGGGGVSNQTGICQCTEVSMTTLTQPTTHGPVTLIDSGETQTNLPEHTLTKDPQRSAKREMGAIRNEQQI